MKKIATAAIMGLAFISGPAFGREHFQVYEGRDSIQEGRGGTRVTKNGIDYWTTGTPPRRYQIIGVLIDKRGLGKLAGEAVGSPSVAKAVKDAGGDAVIVLGEQEKVRGAVGSSFANGYRHWGSAFGWSAPVGDRETELEVVKYLPDATSTTTSVTSAATSPASSGTPAP